MHYILVHLLLAVAAAYYTNIASSVITSANILEERVLWYSAGDGLAGAEDIGSSITSFSRDLLSLKSELSSIDRDSADWTVLPVVIENVANSISGLLEEFTAKAQIFESEGAAHVVRDEISSFWQPTADIIDYVFNLNVAACYPLPNLRADVSALNYAFMSAGSVYSISPVITLPSMSCYIEPPSITLTVSPIEVSSTADDSSQEPPTYTYTGEITTSSFIYTLSAEPTSTPARCRVRPHAA